MSKSNYCSKCGFNTVGYNVGVCSKCGNAFYSAVASLVPGKLKTKVKRIIEEEDDDEDEDDEDMDGSITELPELKQSLSFRIEYGGAQQGISLGELKDMPPVAADEKLSRPVGPVLTKEQIMEQFRAEACGKTKPIIIDGDVK